MAPKSNTGSKTSTSRKPPQGATWRTAGSLRALAASTEWVKRRDSYRIDPRAIEIAEGFNVRLMDDPETRAHIDSIKESIRAFITQANPDNRVCPDGGLGDVYPELVVRVTEGRINLVDGQCRLTATRELIGQEGFDIPFVDVTSTAGTGADLDLIMLRSAQNKHLRPIERAAGLVRLADSGLSNPEIARQLGNTMTPQRVEQLVLLGRAPEGIRHLVEQGVVTADAAIETIRQHRNDPEEAERILQGHVQAKAQTKDGEGDQRPVGKRQTRMALPRKVQEGIFAAVVKETKGLNKQIKELETSGEKGWEDVLVQVELPAGVVRQLLDQQAKLKEASKNTPD